MSSTKKSVEKKTAKRAAGRRIYTEKHIYLFLVCLCLLQTLFLGSLLFVLTLLQIPDIRNVTRYKPPETTIIYDSKGRIVDRMFTENRTVVPITQMSSYLPKAFVAAEDGRFFEHQGLDFFSVIRALIVNLKDGAKSQGGSTITQQVAKSLLLTPEKTYIRKFKEAILAWRIDKLLSKEEILYIYLNQIYLGEGAHGVEAAAQIYFGKSAARLSLGECALLAGLPQAPSRYSLFDHLDRAIDRQRYVLNRMAADGYITNSQARRAFVSDIKLNRRSQTAGEENGYYLEIVKTQAREMLGGAALQQAGVKIFTCLDSTMQQKGTDAIKIGVHELAKRLEVTRKKGIKPQAALVAIESGSGKVRALVGGSSFRRSPFNRASQAKRPAGSTFKPFVFATAVKMGYGPSTTVHDSPMAIKGKNGKLWRPKNYGGKYYGRTTFQDALAKSLNSVSVRTMQKTGYKNVHRLARKAGIQGKLTPDLSLALGAVDLSLLDLTGAYTVFAANGVARKPQFIEKIVRADGKTIYPKKEEPQRVLSVEENQKMRQMLHAVVTVGTGKKLKDVPGIMGGKTGTSDESRDAWFVGYDNSLTIGVWVGFDRNQSLGAKESGGATAVPIWKDFIMRAKGYR